MNILEIYKQYQIMPPQAEHMLRVAGVAMTIWNNFYPLPNPPHKGEKKNLIIACLLHDMGNIIKFDFSQTKKIINQDLDLDYWREVQQAFKAKYGSNEHTAHLQIAKDLGASERVIELIGAISFLGAPNNASGNDWGKKICQYADDRVSPFGVVSLEERFLDLRRRYVNHQGETPEREAFENALRQIETQIFEYCKIRPEEITEERVQEQVVKLRKFEI